MIEREILGDIEIERGYEGTYIGTDIIIHGDVEIWHMPPRPPGPLGVPSTEVVQIFTTLEDGSKYRISTCMGDPRISYKEKAED